MGSEARDEEYRSVNGIDLDVLGDVDVEAAGLFESLRDLLTLLLGEVVAGEDCLYGVVQLGNLVGGQ